MNVICLMNDNLTGCSCGGSLRACKGNDSFQKVMILSVAIAEKHIQKRYHIFTFHLPRKLRTDNLVFARTTEREQSFRHKATCTRYEMFTHILYTFFVCAHTYCVLYIARSPHTDTVYTITVRTDHSYTVYVARTYHRETNK